MTLDDAICIKEGPELWEPVREDETQGDARDRWIEAAQLCELCPAFDPCDQLAESQETPLGVWAGRLPRLPGERKGVTPARCGTRAGWKKHKRNDEEPCDPCIEANRKYSKERKAEKRARR